MTRTITIDTDTSISYIFPEKVFQITNKETSTTRTLLDNAYNVLKVVAGDNPTTTVIVDNVPTTVPVTPQYIIDTIVTPMETVNNLSYTWNSTGAYIQTIQFNDYSKYPLTLDLNKNKLYIMNSNIIYDLTLNESPTPRIQYIQAFYSNTLGLLITFNDLEKIYDLLYSFYLPTVYNNIAPRQTDSTGNRLPLSYTNQIKLSNNSNTSKATYTLTMNPNSTYNYTELARILQLQENVITLASTPTETINIGQTLTLYNANTTVNGTTYTADGDYIVESIEDNTITVDKEFPTPYLYEPPTLNAVAYKSLIESVERANNTITLDNQADLSQFLIGDQIQIKGTTITTEYETLTVDGTYTISDIQAHKIIVEEQPSTDYTYNDEENQPYLYKRILVQNIDTINNKTVTLEDTPLITLTNSDPVVVIYQDKHEEFSTVSNVSNKIITVSDTLTNFTNNSGILQKRTPSPEVLIQVANSKDETLMPNTTFMVDNSTQATAYLSLLNTLTVPTEACYNNSTGKVEETYEINTSTVQYMNLLGLYNEIYSESM